MRSDQYRSKNPTNDPHDWEGGVLARGQILAAGIVEEIGEFHENVAETKTHAVADKGRYIANPFD